MGRDRIYRKIYVEAHGPVPKGYHIHHIDGDPNNNNIENLIAVTPEEHYRLHVEMGFPWKGGKKGWFIGAAEAGSKGGRAKWLKIQEKLNPEKITEVMRNLSNKSSRFEGKSHTKESIAKMKQTFANKPFWVCKCGKKIKLNKGNILQHQRACSEWILQ